MDVIRVLSGGSFLSYLFFWSLVFERIQIRVFDGAMVIVGRGRHSDYEWGY